VRPRIALAFEVFIRVVLKTPRKRASGPEARGIFRGRRAALWGGAPAPRGSSSSRSTFEAHASVFLPQGGRRPCVVHSRLNPLCLYPNSHAPSRKVAKAAKMLLGELCAFARTSSIPSSELSAKLASALSSAFIRPHLRSSAVALVPPHGRSQYSFAFIRVHSRLNPLRLPTVSPPGT
jgi:hypothetical protein